MKYSVDEVKEHVASCEDADANYRALAERAQAAWELKAFNRDLLTAINMDGQEQVVLPTPFNDIGLATRLLSSMPRVEVPASDETEEAEEVSQRKERWLAAAYQRIYQQQRMNVVALLEHFSFLRGRHAFSVNWVKDDYPKNMRDKVFPILIRPLDPLNVGISRNPLYTDYAFHKYCEKVGKVKRRYPKLELAKKKDDAEVDVIDYWWTDPKDGDIWHCIVVDGEFGKKPTKTDYMHIPIVVGHGDLSNYLNNDWSSLPLIYPTIDLWKYQCRLTSQMATMNMWYAQPHVAVTNENGMDVGDIDIKPGVYKQYPMGTRFEQIQVRPDLAIVQTIEQRVASAMQDSTFPKVMYGDAGNIQSGYGVNSLANNAKGRINPFRENLEMSLQHANEIMFSLIETFGGATGVNVWGKDAATSATYRATLNKDDIDGQYDNIVTLEPLIPTDTMQKETLGIRKVEMGIMSRQTYRDKVNAEVLPPDEQLRVDFENVMNTPEMMPKKVVAIMKRKFPDNWIEMIAGTQHEKAIIEAGLAHRMPDGTLMEGQMPPEPQPMQPQGLNNGMGGGIPPQLQGQITPDMLGLPQQGNPLLFQGMTGQQMQPQEELNALAGMPR